MEENNKKKYKLINYISNPFFVFFVLSIITLSTIVSAETFSNSGSGSFTNTGSSSLSGSSGTTSTTSTIIYPTSTSTIDTKTTTTATTPTTVPIPMNFSVVGTLTYTSNSITLGWSDNPNLNEITIIERKKESTGVFELITRTPTNSTSFTDSSSISSNNHYYYRAKACISSTLCSEYTSTIDVFIPSVPTTSPTLVPTTTTTTITPVPTTTTTTITTPPPPAPSTATISPTPINISPTNLSPTIAPVTTVVLPPPPPKPVATSYITEQFKEVTDILSKDSSGKIVVPKSDLDNLINKDSNSDGVSDYDSMRIYNLDPVAPSPISFYDGKQVNAGEKILLGYDPTVPELKRVNKEEPETTEAPTVSTYEVVSVVLTEGKQINIEGIALPNSFVTIYVYSTPIMVVVKTNQKGEWQYTLDKELENGEHTVYLASVNNAGNIVAKSSGYLFTKTAEAVSFNDVPITDTSDENKKPSLLSGMGLYIIIALFIGVITILMVVIGTISSRKKEQ